MQKAKETVAAALSVIGPGQENEIWQNLCHERLIEKQDRKLSKCKNFDTTTALIDVLIKAHNQAQSWQVKRQILSLFANDFSKTHLQQMMPGLSKWRIDQARKHTIQSGKGQLVFDAPIFRCRIEPVKIDHFLNYILRLLNVCSASMQKSLQGLENVTAEGTEAFDRMVATVETLTDNGVEREWQQTVLQKLKNAKRYLKTDYKAHFGREGYCVDHCSVYL